MAALCNPSGNIRASWYLIDDPSQQSTASLWQAISGITLTSSSGQHYYCRFNTPFTAFTHPLNRTIISQTPSEIRLNPLMFHFGVIKMALKIRLMPHPPLLEANQHGKQSANQGDTHAEYYRSDVQPSDWRDSLNDLLTNYTDTKSVTVSAKQISQRDPTVDRTLQEDFISTQDPAYLVRDITPVLLADKPLNIVDTVRLNRPGDVEREVQALRDNHPVTVKYQWQYIEPATSNQWQPVEPASENYRDLTSFQRLSISTLPVV